jgi:uncharacterized coiled-coil protein SlyX
VVRTKDELMACALPAASLTPLTQTLEQLSVVLAGAQVTIDGKSRTLRTLLRKAQQAK